MYKRWEEGSWSDLILLKSQYTTQSDSGHPVVAAGQKISTQYQSPNSPTESPFVLWPNKVKTLKLYIG